MKPKPTKKKPQGALVVHISGYHPVSDNWYPNYEGDLVSFALTESSVEDGNFFVLSFWGADDLGMEKLFLIEKHSRLELLIQLKVFVNNLHTPISQKWLQSQGFIRA